jgi:hypothetical protein
MPGYTPTNRRETLKASDLKLRADALIAADSYNLTPNFFEKNKEIFEKINESVNSIVKSYGFNNKNNSDIVNPLKNYNRVLFNTIDKRNFQDKLMNLQPSNLDSGMRSISSEDTSNSLEEGIVNSFQKITSESFALMDEYRISCELIPELKRVIKLIVRDIINANEITKRSIHDVYSVSEDDTETSTNDIDEINKLIDKNITEKYHIEEKLEIWLYEALTTGAKPLLVVPYRDIIKQALALSTTQNKDGTYKTGTSTNANNIAMAMESIDAMGIEDLETYGYENIDLFNLNKKLKSDAICKKHEIKKMKYNYQSQEDITEYTKSFESFANDIIDDEMVDTIFESGMEELEKTYEMEFQKANDQYKLEHGFEEVDMTNEVFDVSNNIKEFLNNLGSTSDKKEGEVETDEEKLKRRFEAEQKIKNNIKKRLSEFVCQVDSNIDIVDDGFSNLNLTKNSFMKRMNKKKINKNLVDGIYIEDVETLDKLCDDFDGEVLIHELNPENCIPVSIGSQHIQYYIFETEAYEGASTSSSRRSTSFANIVASTGYGNDKAVINASNGVSLVPNDPALSSVFNPANFGNMNMPLQGNDIFENDGTRVDIMKQIVYRTLAKRMCDPSLSENKSFTDAIMNLIRQGYIVNRQIKFTSVPATNVVYLAHDIDDKGLPHSILDGTLLQIYMYLAGIVSMTLNIVNKSSDKEKLEVNMGMSHQIGMTLMEIQKQLSTRNIHVKSFFNNIGSVLRNVATYARYSIPVVDGEKLYDISTVEKNADSPIDTDFIEKRLSSVLSSIPAPPAILNMMQEAEFSRSIVNQNLEYRNSINEKEYTFGKQITKLYRLISIYSKLAIPVNPEEKELQSDASNTSEDSKLKKVDIKNINVRFVSPTYLNMVNISETFTNIEPVIDSFAKYIFGEDADTVLDKHMIQKFKKECVKIFAGNIDLAYIEQIAQKIKDNPFEGESDEIKNKIIAKQTENLLNGDDIGDSDSGGDDEESFNL